MKLRKVWFVFDLRRSSPEEVEYTNIRIRSHDKLRKKAFKWLKKEGIKAGKRTWHDEVLSPLSEKITFEEGDLMISWEYTF